MTKEEKKKEIAKIEKEQISIIKKVIAVPVKTTKNPHVALKRAFRIVALVVRNAQLQHKKLIIASQHEGFKTGGVIQSKQTV